MFSIYYILTFYTVIAEARLGRTAASSSDADIAAIRRDVEDRGEQRVARGGSHGVGGLRSQGDSRGGTVPNNIQGNVAASGVPSGSSQGGGGAGGSDGTGGGAGGPQGSTTAGRSLQRLRRLIAPLSATTDGSARFPVVFGPAAEGIMMRKAVDHRILWWILQARVHETSKTAFCHELHKVLGGTWEARDLEELWEGIVFPYV